MSENNYNITPSKIIGVQFSILSPDEIRKSSVAHITSRDTYINNKPVINGLFDPRMGVLEPGLICPTDGLNYMETPGYFGHIELARPVFYIQYLTHILKIMKCVCFKCSKLLIDKSKYKQALEKNNQERWDFVFSLASSINRCGEENNDGCGCKQPDKIRKEGLATIYAEWKNLSEVENEQLDEQNEQENNITIKLTPEIVLKIFKRISDEDIEFMGFSSQFSRPEWMICQVLAVPPPAVRPSIKHDAQQRSEDDISHIIVNIIKANKTLMEKLQQNAKENIIDDWTTVLQYYVATMINNKIPGVAAVAQRSGRPLKSISERLNGKFGRVRGNLMGKRVDFSSRSVITADPNLSIRQLGVPKKIAMNITYPVTVNDRNKNYLLQLVKNGPDVYPGAKILEKESGESISLKYLDRSSVELNNGDIVHRHMLDGDAVLFNRQPSLHRMSMMCHIAKIMNQGDTFRMNVADTKPYNADFDGDEMNMHMPQNDESSAELRNLAAIPRQIISPANNSSIIGIFQDSLLGSYRITRPNMRFTMREAMNLLMGIKKLNKDTLKNKKYLSNFDLISQILPPMTSKFKNNNFDDDEDPKTSNNIIEIINGSMKKGQFDKSIKKIINTLFNDFGFNASSDFIDNIQNIVTEYMKISAFSVGISDLIAEQETNNKIAQAIMNKKQEVKDLIDQIKIGVFENNTGKSNYEEFETSVNSILNKAQEEAGKIGRKSLSEYNRFKIMVQAGSKGSDLNIAQMISCLGQQNVDGKRIPYGFEDRTLPHFKKFDDSPEARGFVESSFIQGLTPQELFFHAMGGRVGLIDTAVKSVAWDTPIVIISNNKPLYIPIGKWVDSYLDNEEYMRDIQYIQKDNMELLDITNKDEILIPTTDMKGNVSWEKITAVTRHDPGKKLFKITTTSGRDVIVTASKSLIVWDEDTDSFIEKYTEEITCDDFLPVNAELDNDKSVELDEVVMDEYFPKNQYIHGSEYNKAVRLMKDAMKNKNKIPNGWWESMNNNKFTLPYTKKSSLARSILRDKSNIEDDKIYPYGSSRLNNGINNKFKLNKENGIFIGLFIAEGNIHNGKIVITNNDENIINYVKEWFSKNSIYYNVTTNTNNYGTSTSVIGHSTLMSKLIRKMVGHLAHNKQVPKEAFISNKEFVIGILNGYFSGDGSVSKNSIDASSSSKQLINNISMLCSRLNIFTKLWKSQLKCNNFNTKNIKPSYRISIRSKWGKIFSENIILIHSKKQQKLSSITWKTNYTKYKQVNNVVLDKIVKIESISPEYHPKMYDLTIPKTLNFGLANGLQVRDTSQTGYIQRRLIKGMEDLKVEYDMSVRNNMGKIVQFTYGDDNIDTTKVEGQNIPIVNMNIEEIYSHFFIPVDDLKDELLITTFTQDAYNKINIEMNEYNKNMKQIISNMLEKRDLLVKYIFNYKNNSNVNIPVNFKRIITNIKHQLNINGNNLCDITPLECLNILQKYKNNLNKIVFSKPTDLFFTLFDYYLCPKELLIHHRFNKKSLEVLLNTIVVNYKKAIVAPGEMVGMVAAQSIGEPTTQMTLNTFHFAGVSSKSNVTRGVPRIEEILSLSKQPKNPSLTVALRDSEKYDKLKAQQMIHIIEHTSLRDIVKSVSICFDPDNLNTLVNEDKELIEQYKEFETMISEANEDQEENNEEFSKWIIRFELDKEEMLDKNINMDDVHFSVENGFKDQISCVFSDYNSDKLIFRVRILDNQMKKIESKKSLLQNEQMILDQSDEIYILKNIQENLLNSIILRGIKNISKVILRKVQDSVELIEGNYKTKESWVLDTVGTNLLDILSLDNIDTKNTVTNDIFETYNILGIEAARQTIYNEITDVIEFDGTYINYHHISLLCDRMCYSKNMISIFRHGINNDNIGPIAKASFEETPEMFLRAARHAEMDNMRGVSANVMCGQEGNYGTGSFQLVLDIKDLGKMKSKILREKKSIENMFGLEEDEDICNLENIKYKTNIATIKPTNVGNDNDYNPGF